VAIEWGVGFTFSFSVLAVTLTELICETG